MNVRAPKFDKAFIEKQRNYLTQLRAALLAAARSDEADEANVKSDNDAGPREYEDDAQKLAILELDGNLVVRDIERLNRVDRALREIETEPMACRTSAANSFRESDSKRFPRRSVRWMRKRRSNKKVGGSGAAGDAPMDRLVLGGGHQHEWR
jgi:RNA polymerase-binding transcription factor DksA